MAKNTFLTVEDDADKAFRAATLRSCASAPCLWALADSDDDQVEDDCGGCHESTEYESNDARSTCSWTTEPDDDEAVSEHSSSLPSSCPSAVPTPTTSQLIVGDRGIAQLAIPDQADAESSIQNFWPMNSNGYGMPCTGYSMVYWVCPQQIEEGPTTINLKNLPSDCTLSKVLETLDKEGFASYYNFVHVPVSFVTKESVGYAQVNLYDHATAMQLSQHFQGFTEWGTVNSCSSKECEASLNSGTSGLDGLIERYRNSPIMHEKVPEEYKPALFCNGQRISFPAPTMRIKPPRMRHQKPNQSMSEDQ
jgi:hypothetical protein